MVFHRYYSCFLVFVFGFAIAMGSVSASHTDRHVTVVELFTSQGCSSCPPADRLLGGLKYEDGFLALSFHVDYWDRLGWKDTFSSSHYTARQRHYSRNRNGRSIYTPEFVINGDNLASINSRERPWTRIADEHASTPSVWADLSVQRADGGLRVSIGGSPAGGVDADVLLLPILTKASVSIKRGENRGRTVTYHNVVRSIQRVGKWGGRAAQFSVALPKVDADAYVALVQRSGQGEIIGAALLR